ncbi:MAG TPA: hypothetical protein VMZ53_12490 [Kofleriaceae bacterium]|nr:hypothetical protein [Kofleriaceae bacterium]
MGSRNGDGVRAKRRRLRVPAALAVALVGSSMSIAASVVGCSPSEEPPVPDAQPGGTIGGTRQDASVSGDGAGSEDAGLPPDAPSVTDAALDAPLEPTPDAPHT